MTMMVMMMVNFTARINYDPVGEKSELFGTCLVGLLVGCSKRIFVDTMVAFAHRTWMAWIPWLGCVGRYFIRLSPLWITTTLNKK